MFTGIVDHCGIITEVSNLQAGKRLTIQTQFTDLSLGESIAVDGACLTVAGFNGEEFSCDLSPETLSLTIFAHIEAGAKVNLERSMRLDERMSGHFVSGHVDQIARLAGREEQSEFLHLTVAGILPELQVLLVKKGSISVNGVSLTLNSLTPDGFTLMLIPETLARSNLGNLKIGNLVNIEFDMLAKMINQQINYNLAKSEE